MKSLIEEEVETKQFCDCYDHDFRTAVRKLAQIVDMQPINDSIKTTASMYLKTEQDINVQKYIKHLEDELTRALLAGEKKGAEGVRESLAEIEHEQWIAWSKNIAETESITSERLARWKELWRPYAELTEAEKDQDREWADRVLQALKTNPSVT